MATRQLLGTRKYSASCHIFLAQLVTSAATNQHVCWLKNMNA